jgi:hypothetical protein
VTTHQLYGSRFSGDDLETERPSARRQQSSQGVLGSSVGDVTTISAEPGDRRLTGTFVGKYSELMAAEVRELLAAGDQIDAIPYFLPDAERDWEGFYSPSEARDGARRDPRVQNVATFDGVLSRLGSRDTHVREVQVRPQTVDNPFSSPNTSERVAIPETANNPRWVYLPGGEVNTNLSVQATSVGETAALHEFDPANATFSGQESYRLVYDVPFLDEAPADVRVFDDFFRDRAQTTNNGNLTVDPSWQRVYQTQHDYAGVPVVSNGRVRVRPDFANNRIVVEQWDVAAGSWTTVSPGTSPWQLDTWRVERIGLARVVCRGRWFDSNNPGDTYELVVEVSRGTDSPLFLEPENASSTIPLDLFDLLNPYASEAGTANKPVAGILKRERIPDE